MNIVEKIYTESEQYYNPSNLLNQKSVWNFIIGERSNGKSFAFKKIALDDYFDNPTSNKFAYCRRWTEDIRPKFVDKYFNDKALREYISFKTDGAYNCIKSKQGEFRLCYEDELGKIHYGVCCGYIFSLNNAEHYKSLNYDDVSNILFEEFITYKRYLPNEVRDLLSIVSTIKRKREIKIYCIANTDSRICPYFDEFNLFNVKKQKLGTIETYLCEIDGSTDTTRVSVEYCPNSLEKSSDILASTKQATSMINGGEWFANHYPTLTDLGISSKTLLLLYRMFYEFENNMFIMEFMKFKDRCFWFIRRKKDNDVKSNKDRIISDKYYPDNKLWSNDFKPLCKKEILMFEYLKDKKIFFADSLTGEEFYNCYESIKNQRINFIR